ncbi:terpenoid cyclases/protein prenyltransferase alpha-alpha toroid [Xylogone sp. PMI_703]|nr:terpenoid cyclases/protein prenyltransferase alpha-alpha toroid [Xylogone sp. PMI_703]
MGEPKLEVDRHIKYWKRCLRTLLPTEYTSTDSSRMSLGFFILSALDILGAGADTFPTEERENIKNWALRCQHPNGGFCGSPNHRFPDEYYAESGGKQTDPANLPATFFALIVLSFVGDFAQVKRLECLRWLKTLQREDGSFGELVSPDGTIEGGRDMRYCYVATAIRWMLRGDAKDDEDSDINVEKLVNHIRSGQTYDGGISESSLHESHAGYTYCAIATLSLLGRLPSSSPSSEEALIDIPAAIHWLVSRQIEFIEPKSPEEKELYLRHSMVGVYEDSDSAHKLCAGFNGRWNKLPDTCYCFWVSGSLDVRLTSPYTIAPNSNSQLMSTLKMLGHVNVIDKEATRRFLFEKTQHRIGGFAKFPGHPPGL